MTPKKLLRGKKKTKKVKGYAALTKRGALIVATQMKQTAEDNFEDKVVKCTITYEI